MRRKCIGILLVLPFLLSACLPSYTIEELAIITGRGIDLTDDKKIERTLNVIRFDPQAPNTYTTLTGIGDTMKGARENASYQIAFKLVEGQLNMEIFGKEAAQQGITPYVSGTVRDARASDTTKVMVSNTTAKELFNSASPKSDTLGDYFDKLINKQVSEGSLPSATLRDFSRKTETIGQDGVMPLVGIEDNTPKIIGIALFKDYKYVSDISLKQGILLNLFRNRLNGTQMEVNLPHDPFKKYIKKEAETGIDDNAEIAFQIMVVNGNSTTKVKDIKDQTFQTDIDKEVDLQEISDPVVFEDTKVARTFEKEMEKKIKSQFEALLKQIQEVNVDPFGFGKIYRANTKDGKLTDKEWREKFPDIKVDFNVNVKLMHHGTIQ